MLNGSVMVERLRLDDCYLSFSADQNDLDVSISLPRLRDLSIICEDTSTPLRLIQGLRAPLLKKFMFKLDSFGRSSSKTFLLRHASEMSSFAPRFQNLVWSFIPS